MLMYDNTHDHSYGIVLAIIALGQYYCMSALVWFQSSWVDKEILMYK